MAGGGADSAGGVLGQRNREKGNLQVLQHSAKIQEGLRTKEIDGRKPFVKKAA